MEDGTDHLVRNVLPAVPLRQWVEADRRVRSPDPFPHARRSAFLDGFSLYAGVHIHANDRAGAREAVPLCLAAAASQDEAGHLVYG
jgi:hypothetical protein